jgi:hypothetical protein
LEEVTRLAGPVEINPAPQEVEWTVPLDEDREHTTYEAEHVDSYFTAATQAALVLAEFRAPYRGRATPVNAWWGTFDLALAFFSGRPAQPPSDEFIIRNSGNAEQIEIGWWPGDSRHGEAAFFAFAHPAPEGYAEGEIEPDAARWDTELGEFVLEWEEIRSEPNPHRLALEFAQSAFQHSCAACGWDRALGASAAGDPPPIT